MGLNPKLEYSTNFAAATPPKSLTLTARDTSTQANKRMIIIPGEIDQTEDFEEDD
jgi:hypothetical protein